MSVSRWSLGMFLISTLFFFGVTVVRADEAMATTPFDGADLSYASLSVVDTRLDSVEGNPDLVLSAKLQNTGDDTRTFRVGVEFRGATETNQGESAVVHAPVDYTVPAGEELSIAFSVFRPVSLEGTYDTALLVNDDKGNTVTRTSLSRQELVATERVTVKNCTFGPSDGDNGILVSAMDEKQSEIIVACEAALVKGKPAVIRMVARMADYRTAMPVVLGEKTLALSTVAIPVRLFVSAKEAGQYQLEVVMVNENNQDISAPVRVPLTVKGNGGKILGLSELKRESTQSVALTVGAAIELADGAEYTLSYALLSGGVACAEPVSVSVRNTNLKEAVLQVTKNCDAPVLSATLLTDGSTVLDQAEKSVGPITGIPTSMMEKSFFDGILPKLPWIIVAILGVFAGYFIWQKERLRRMAPVLVLALASAFFGFSVDRVEAASTGFTLFCNSGAQVCPSDATVFYNFWTDKEVYAPGEIVRITMSIASDDHPVPASNLCPVVQMRINSGSNGPDLVSGCYSANQFTAGLELNLTQTAPMTAGAFTIGVTVGQNGYTSPASRTLSGLSVAATPTPTASLNISPTTANFPTMITYTLSSTNAQSCEVVQTSPTNVTFINKSTNTTGTSLQSQVAVGSYQFQTRCWSGPNGTGTVSSTDTDSLTINTPPAQPSASFTSTPSCTITAGSSGCNTTLGWTSANLTTAVLTDCGNVQLASRGVGNQTASGIYVPYNSGCYRIHDATRTGTVLTTGNVSSSCASGTTWNGSICQGSAVVNGTCGSAHTTTVSGAPSPAQQCSAGTVGNQDAYLSGDTFNSNGFINAGPSNSFYLGYYWECNGSGGGTSRGCFANRQPLCGSADGGSFSSAPTDDSNPMKQTLCQVGTPSSVTTNASTYTWSCTNGTGPTDFCSATRTTGPTVQITASVKQYSLGETSLWRRAISYVTGKEYVAKATGPAATISTTGTANIRWTSSGASSCTVSGRSYSSGLMNSNTDLSGATLGQGTWTYTLSCFGPGGNASDTVNVIVEDAGGGAPSGPPGGSGGFFNASPAACGTGTINLSWNSVSGATSYQLRDGSTQIYSGASTSYSHTGLTAGSAHSYTVRSTNSNGSSAWSSVRNANAPNTCPPGGFSVNLTASPANIVSGSSTLSWTTGGNPTWCWATGGNEGTWNNTWQSVSGSSRVVTPPVTTTYTLECGDASTSVSDTATVTVGSGFTCTGSMSNHATVYSGDSTGLSANTPYSYSATNTAPKCQYTCDTGYTWDGSQCAGPSVTLTASPSTIASGDSSTLTWTPSSGVTSCWATNGTAPWTNSSRSASGGTQVVSPNVTTTYSIECWNAAAVSTGIRNRTITVTGGGPAAAVNVCPGSATLGVATTQQFSAYYTAAGVAWNGCGSPNGTNVTSSATWSSSNASVATMNNGPSKGLATGVAAGSATMSAVYSGLTANAGVTISCTPTNTCNSASSQTRATSICAGDTFNINDGCGGTLTCSGTRVCDYNWKEVAP